MKLILHVGSDIAPRKTLDAAVIRLYIKAGLRKITQQPWLAVMINPVTTKSIEVTQGECHNARRALGLSTIPVLNVCVSSVSKQTLPLQKQKLLQFATIRTARQLYTDDRPLRRRGLELLCYSIRTCTHVPYFFESFSFIGFRCVTLCEEHKCCLLAFICVVQSEIAIAQIRPSLKLVIIFFLTPYLAGLPWVMRTRFVFNQKHVYLIRAMLLDFSLL